MASHDLIAEYLKLSEHEEGAFSNGEFWNYIAHTYIGVLQEPRSLLLKVYVQASEDMKSVDAHLEFIGSEELRLERDSKAATAALGEINYYRKQLDFYKSRNVDAKAEIVEFLTLKIKTFVIAEVTASSGIRVSAFKPVPYPYARIRTVYSLYPNFYDVKSLTPLFNKFGDLHVRAINKIEKLYRDDPEEFFSFAREHIARGGGELRQGVVTQIRTLVEANHNLHARREVINRIICHYESGDFISFINMVPLQIEGIFHDICVEVGIEIKLLNGASINGKLDRLRSTLGYIPNYEYYSFMFPVFRNLVAHGGMISGDLEKTAVMLMLDFLPVCEMTMNEDIPLNKTVEFLRDFELQALDYEQLIDWSTFCKVEVPSFYGLTEVRDGALSLFATDVFWDYLEDELERSVNFEESRYLEVATRLIHDGLAGDRGKLFIKKKRAIRGRVEERRLRVLASIAARKEKAKG
jgi:hypothetical protein